jgi:hypothetical protein
MRLKKGSSMISSRKQEARMSNIYKCIMLGCVFFTTKNTNRVQSSQLRYDETKKLNPINPTNPTNHSSDKKDLGAKKEEATNPSSDSKKRLTGIPDAFLGFPENISGTPANFAGTPKNISCRQENFKRVISF